MDSLEKFRQTLKSEGQSVTNARRSVFEALLHQEPLTVAELVARCVRIDRASVYRAIALFEELGIVQRLQTGWKYKVELAGAFHDHHHHATCLLCGHSAVLSEDVTIEDRLRNLARQVKFKLERHQIELQGYCAACQELLED
ncbi:MAG TPA: Fur family transcriptional regulator [Candidatus Saccharimonadales bacterium]|nr:Fur family transcriptional regulator [Candidatus Saccharimonadales bacterium]